MKSFDKFFQTISGMAWLFQIHLVFVQHRKNLGITLAVHHDIMEESSRIG